MRDISRRASVVVALALMADSLLFGRAAAEASSLTLKQALHLARLHNLELKLARAELDLARSRRIGALVSHPLNPMLNLNPGLRVRDDRKLSLDLQFGLEWEVEIGGQKGYRIGAAKHALRAAIARVHYLEWAISRQVLLAFHEVLLVRARQRLCGKIRALTEVLYRSAKKRFESGEDSLLPLNLARLELAQVDKRRLELEAALARARTRLTVLIGLSPRRPVDVTGTAPLPGPLTQPLKALIERALVVRRDLAALQQRILANRQRIRLADAKRIPNLVFSLSYGREEDAHLIVAGIGLSLPFFQRNQGERATLRAIERQLSASREKLRLEVERAVVVAYLAQRAARRRLTHFDAAIFRRFEEQLRLLEESFKSGRIRLVNVLLVQRELLASQREIIDTKGALIRARIRLEQAVGGSLTLDPKGVK